MAEDVRLTLPSGTSKIVIVFQSRQSKKRRSQLAVSLDQQTALSICTRCGRAQGFDRIEFELAVAKQEVEMMAEMLQWSDEQRMAALLRLHVGSIWSKQRERPRRRFTFGRAMDGPVVVAQEIEL